MNTRHLHWVIRGGHREIVFNGTATYAEERLNDLVQAWLMGARGSTARAEDALTEAHLGTAVEQSFRERCGQVGYGDGRQYTDGD